MIILYPKDYWLSARELCIPHQKEQLEETLVLLRTVSHRLINEVLATQLEMEMCPKDDEKSAAVMNQLPTNVNFMGLKRGLKRLLEESAGPTDEDHPLVAQVARGRDPFLWLCAHGCALADLHAGKNRELFEWFYYHSPRPRPHGDPLAGLSRTCQYCVDGTIRP